MTTTTKRPSTECVRHQTRETRIRRVYRIDMDDATGTPMCPQCTEDALESGVFTTTRIGR